MPSKKTAKERVEIELEELREKMTIFLEMH